MTIVLEKSVKPSRLRAEYLSSLAEPQEYFVELMVQQGITVTCDDTTYAVIHNDNLVELYCTELSTERGVKLLHQLFDDRLISTVLCKSYDSQLLNAALSRDAKVSTVAYLFRRTVAVPRPALDAGMLFRAAVITDVEAIMAFNDGFFESVDELSGYLNRDGLFVLEWHEEIVACGTGTAVVPGERDIDVGVLVSVKHRNHGLGHVVVHAVKEHYLARGFRPICGCAVRNLASKRVLEKAGFISEHRLLSIQYESVLS